MDNKITQRINELFLSTGLSVTTFAKKLNISRQAVYGLFKGAQPSSETIEKLSKLSGYSTDYILGRTDDNPFYTDNLLGRSEISNVSNAYIPSAMVYLPVIGSVRAGYDGIVEEYDTGELVPIPKEVLKGRSPKEYMVLDIKGDSMYPKYCNGDRVLVLRQDSVDSGTNAVVLYNGDEATVKKVIYEQGEDWIELVPYNPEFKTKRIEGSDLELCKVLGRVIMLLRDDNKIQEPDEYTKIADEARELGIPPEDIGKILELYRKYTK